MEANITKELRHAAERYRALLAGELEAVELVPDIP